MSEQCDAPSLGPWRSFLHAHSRVLEVLERELRAELGLPLSWYEVLLHLSQAPEGRRRMNHLADSVLLSKSGLTRLVDRMVVAGLVERSYCSVDRRGTYASLTDKGRELFERAGPIHVAGVRRHFLGHLSEADQEALGAALDKILEALPAHLAPAA